MQQCRRDHQLRLLRFHVRLSLQQQLPPCRHHHRHSCSSRYDLECRPHLGRLHRPRTYHCGARRVPGPSDQLLQRVRCLSILDLVLFVLLWAVRFHPSQRQCCFVQHDRRHHQLQLLCLDVCLRFQQQLRPDCHDHCSPCSHNQRCPCHLPRPLLVLSSAQRLQRSQLAGVWRLQLQRPRWCQLVLVGQPALELHVLRSNVPVPPRQCMLKSRYSLVWRD